MKIAFIGAGNMATGLGKHWAANKSHELLFSHSRDQGKVKQSAASVSSGAKTGTAEEAAAFADVLVLATPYEAAPAALKAAGKLDGKLIWSIVNPLKPDYSGLQVGTNTSGAEELAKLVPGARFISALPPFAEALHAGALPTPAPTVFVCGDDDKGRETVCGLVKELGADSLDAGPLFAARFFEPAMMGLVYLAYGQKMGGRIGLRFLHT
jgi:8-hydroxy-5-deazaflavin:NADPH oxidoreductase